MLEDVTEAVGDALSGRDLTDSIEKGIERVDTEWKCFTIPAF
jgi:hypothetical protein